MSNQAAIAIQLEDKIIASYNFGNCHPDQFASIIKQKKDIESIKTLFEDEIIELENVDPDVLDFLAEANHVYLFDKIWFYFDTEEDCWIEL